VVALVLLMGVSSAAQEQAAVEVADNEFTPDRVEVDAGTTVVWTQSGGNPHTVTADDGSFDSSATCPPNFTDCMQEGDTFEHTFDQPGEFAYHCKIHGGEGGQGMSGVVVVRAAAQPEPAPEQPAPEQPAPEQPSPPPTSSPAAAAESLPATGGPAGLGWLVVGGSGLLAAGVTAQFLVHRVRVRRESARDL